MAYGLGMRRKAKTERVSARVTRHCRGLLNAVMQKLGISESNVLELAMREYAERHGIEPVYWGEEEG